MRCISFSFSFCFSILCFCAACSGTKDPFTPDYKNVKGFVIGKETCNTDESQDYWLIDFTFLPDPPIIGDSLIFNGIAYRNVLKTNGLDDRAKVVGMRVSIDYRIITKDKVFTTGCTVSNPATYPLKALTILNQYEIR